MVSGEHKRHPTFQRESPANTGGLAMKRASLLTLTLIGAFSAIRCLGRLIIRYLQPEADWLGKIKRIRCKKWDKKPSGRSSSF